ncbi:IucA/IucC family protein [Bacillus coahuilensis]|uniref:IucA/IucC family protein n=1 Tax=Bacillus coahuilensis TaxID=408580 RepID=UPI0001851049|nr:IucA/IucC family protein [Bacillus coahuilensis]
MSLRCKQYETSFGRVHRQFVEAIIFEQLLAIEEETSVFLIYGKSKVYRYEGKRTAFDRVRLYSSVFCDQTDGFHLQHISELMDELVVNSEEATRLVEDLVQTVALLEWNEIHSPLPFSRRASSYEELESEIQEGHTYHPFFKTRRGFSLEDHQRYGPESKLSFSLLWAAVKKEYLPLLE